MKTLALVVAITLAAAVQARPVARAQPKTPTKASIAGLPISGPIKAKTGQVIAGLHITSTAGPCIVISPGVTGVKVTNNEIGPCGAPGDARAWAIDTEGSDVTVSGNVIHDAPSGVVAYLAKGPIVIDHNLCYAMRGPLPSGACVQFHSTSGAGQKVTCNVSDATQPGSLFADHFNLFQSSGTSDSPIEIGWNRMQGGQSGSGSGITLGDATTGDPGGWQWAHDNQIAMVWGAGITVTGGHDQRVTNNLMRQDGAAPASMTFDPLLLSALHACSGVTVTGNRGIGRRWDYGGNGLMSPAAVTPQNCSAVAMSGNNWVDATVPQALFSTIPAACR